MKPHKFAEWIKAKADGHAIQYSASSNNGAEDGWCDMRDNDWSFVDCMDYRIKPAAPKWPETTMTYEELTKAYNDGQHINGVVSIANAALRHACETGQLVLPDPERDMKIAKEVRHAVINAWGSAVEHEEYAAMSNVNLESIIKEATK